MQPLAFEIGSRRDLDDTGPNRFVDEHAEQDGATTLEFLDATIPATAVAVIDALAGRGPALGTVLDAAPEVVDALAQVGAFLRGQAAAPQLPGP